MSTLKQMMKPQIQEWRVSRWDQWLNGIYQVPIGVTDVDYLIMALYGKMFIAAYRSQKDEALKKLPVPGPIGEVMEDPMADFPTVAESIRKDQRRALSSFDEHFNTPDEHITAPAPTLEDHKAALERSIAPSAPLVEQPREVIIEQLKQEQNLAAGGRSIDPDEENRRLVNIQKIRDTAQDPMEQKWEIAEQVARHVLPPLGPNQLGDTELVTMIQYCEWWIREAGDIPERPIPVVDIYWERKSVDQDEQTLVRRKAIVERVVTLWKDIISKNRDKMDLMVDNEDNVMGLSDYDVTTNALGVYNEFDRCLRHGRDVCSYRVVQTAIKLQQVVEEYSIGYKLDGQPNRVPDETLNANVFEAMKGYYKAHLPLKDEVGPKEMMDPNYINFRLLVRKYQLDPLKYLHEQLKPQGR